MFRSFITTEPKKNIPPLLTYKCNKCGMWFLSRTGICPRSNCQGQGTLQQQEKLKKTQSKE